MCLSYFVPLIGCIFIFNFVDYFWRNDSVSRKAVTTVLFIFGCRPVVTGLVRVRPRGGVGEN